MEDKRAKFLKIFSNIPETLRESIVAVVDNKPYTWNVAYIEIKNKTELGKKILKIMEELELV
jgi:hypothetical protein